jgi:hypothetical protein
MVIKNKKLGYGLLIVALMMLIGFSIFNWIANTKPTMDNFVTLMEERYNIECMDIECTSFNFELTENGQKKSILMLTHSGTTSNKTTSFSIEKNYFSEPGSKYFLRLKVKGALGKFTIVEESENLFK